MFKKLIITLLGTFTMCLTGCNNTINEAEIRFIKEIYEVEASSGNTYSTYDITLFNDDIFWMWHTIVIPFNEEYIPPEIEKLGLEDSIPTTSFLETTIGVRFPIRGKYNENRTDKINYLVLESHDTYINPESESPVNVKYIISWKSEEITLDSIQSIKFYIENDLVLEDTEFRLVEYSNYWK